MLSSSIGKYPTVAPYSGHMLEMVARSAMDNWTIPGPKNSTNFPTTPICRKCYNYKTKNINYYCGLLLMRLLNNIKTMK